MEIPNRIFNCVRCHQQVIICSHCDRGNSYCSASCSLQSRQQSVRRAGRRYQQTSQGRHHNALRQKRFRRRQREKVTHQGSLPQAAYSDSSIAKSADKNDINHSASLTIDNHCHFCGENATQLMRHVFLHCFTMSKRTVTKAHSMAP